jgi:hypothetical protein
MLSLRRLLRPPKGHFFQAVEIAFGIDEGRGEMAVPEHIGNGLKRMTFLEHSGGKAMPEGMSALARNLDPRGPQVTLNNGGKRVGMCKSVIGGTGGQRWGSGLAS